MGTLCTHKGFHTTQIEVLRVHELGQSECSKETPSSLVLGGLDFGKRRAHEGTLSTKSEHSEYSHGYFEYHAGTRVLTWALLVLTYGTLSTHMDAGSDRARYTE
jgi:hypothetical protein